MGGDVLAVAARDFVANFKFLHELKKLVAHIGVLTVGPNGFEVFAGELAKVGFYSGVVEDFVDGGGAPVGFEDEALAEDGISLEVEDDTEVVEKLAEGLHFGAIADLMTAADGFVFGIVDVVAAVVFEGIADGEPFIGEGDAVGDEGFDFALEGGLKFGESTIVGEVGAVGVAEVGKFAA